MLITFSHVAKYVFDVTDEQIGKCHAAFEGSQRFYMVESEQDSLIEYKVTYSRQFGFRCTCKSGECGFANVRHISGVCKHVRWSVACTLEVSAALAEMERDALYERLHIGYASVDTATLRRVALRNEVPFPIETV